MLSPRSLKWNFILCFSVVILIGDIFVALTADEAPKSKTPVVSVQKLSLQSLSDEVSYPARVVSKVYATVNSEIDGVVQRIIAPLGRSVGRGSPLFVIKNTDPVYQYVSVQLVSPVAGVVSSLELAEGAMVKRGQILATITDPSQVRMDVEIAAADLSRFSAGVVGDFFALSTDENATKVKVTGVSPLVDPATGTATATLEPVTPKAKGLQIGIIGRVRFSINQRQGIQVPEQALVYRGSEVFLRVLNDNKAKFAPVKISETRRGMVGLSSGVSAGETYIVRSSAFVADGQIVTVQEDDVAKK